MEDSFVSSIDCSDEVEQQTTERRSHKSPIKTDRAETIGSGEKDDDEEQQLVQESNADHDDDVPMTFPQRLMNIIADKRFSDVIGWLPHGKGFVIYKKKKFAVEVLPAFFKKSKFTSFTRKLNRWGFVRVTRGPETGAYYHDLFRNGDLRLCMQMTCQPSAFKAATTAQQQQQPNLVGAHNPAAIGMFGQGNNFAGDMSQLFLGVQGVGLGQADIAPQNQQQALIRQQLQQLQMQQLQLHQLQMQQQQQQLQAAEFMRQAITKQQMQNQGGNSNMMSSMNAVMQQQMLMNSTSNAFGDNNNNGSGNFNINASLNKMDDSAFLQSLQRAKESGNGLLMDPILPLSMMSPLQQGMIGNIQMNNSSNNSAPMREPTRPPAGNGRAWAA